ncbi:MAG: hypothetical protein HY327_13365 [Chloroflexi bacterium]|nr:hypothetical protein [Chloroflexota bacterium]
MFKSNGRSHKFGFKALFVAVGLFTLAIASGTQAHAANDAPAANEIRLLSTPLDALDGITFAGAYGDDDVAYLSESLQMLNDKMPAWAEYIAQAKPLILSIDLTEGAHGRAAIAKCCLGERGVITFGHHFGTLADSSDPQSESPEARRITFLATLAHEVTHIRDQRAGKFLTKTDYKSCVAAEKSGLEKQLEFQQDALNAELSNNATSAQTYRAWLEQNVKAEARALKSRDLWNQYCGAFLG